MPRMSIFNTITVVQEGAGHAVLSAFVEIVLDNSDGRIQVSHLHCLAICLQCEDRVFKPIRNMTSDASVERRLRRMRFGCEGLLG